MERHNIKYKPVFSDLGKIFEEVSQELAKPTFSENMKIVEKAI